MDSDATTLLPAPPTDGRALRRHDNARRLYDAADELLATTGFEDLNVDDICALADVGRATFFRIYGTKAGLLREFNRRLAHDAERRLDIADAIDVRASLGIIADAIVDAWRDARPGHLGMARAFAQSVPHTDPHAAHPELFALVHRIVITGIDRGELPDVVPSKIVASLALIHLTAPIAYTLAGGSTDIDRLAHTLLDQWYAGVTASSPDSDTPNRTERT
jgi:AcrR family transcriptional regulator